MRHSGRSSLIARILAYATLRLPQRKSSLYLEYGIPAGPVDIQIGAGALLAGTEYLTDEKITSARRFGGRVYQIGRHRGRTYTPGRAGWKSTAGNPGGY